MKNLFILTLVFALTGIAACTDKEKLRSDLDAKLDELAKQFMTVQGLRRPNKETKPLRTQYLKLAKEYSRLFEKDHQYEIRAYHALGVSAMAHETYDKAEEALKNCRKLQKKYRPTDHEFAWLCVQGLEEVYQTTKNRAALKALGNEIDAVLAVHPEGAQIRKNRATLADLHQTLESFKNLKATE